MYKILGTMIVVDRLIVDFSAEMDTVFWGPPDAAYILSCSILV